MKFKPTLNIIGFILVGCCFVFSASRLLERFLQRNIENRVIIRFAHFLQDDSIVNAFAMVADKYMDRHPEVFIEQIIVPKSIFSIWIKTRLIGDFAPDIMPYMFSGGGVGLLLQSEFVALDQYFEEPNPYNKNTSLEGLPWRMTFIDALQLSGYIAHLNNFYGVLLSPRNSRLVYNKRLFQKIAGDETVPTNFGEFLQLCEKVHAFNRGIEENIMPIVGYGKDDLLMRQVMASQTHSLSLKMNKTRRLYAVASERLITYIGGDWSLRSEQIRLGLELAQKLGKQYQPGFMQQKKQDALFYFLQERALMIETNGLEVQSIKSQVAFPLGVMKNPMPDEDDPKYGKHYFGRESELKFAGHFTFGLTRQSEHPDVAIDFLRYLTSQQVHQEFVRLCGIVPAIIGVNPREDTEEFVPIAGSYPGGRGFPTTSGNEGGQFNSGIHGLFEKGLSVDEFIDTIEPGYAEAIVKDWVGDFKQRLIGIRAFDSKLGALWFVGVKDRDMEEDESDEILKQISQVLENQLEQESLTSWGLQQMKLNGYTASPVSRYLPDLESLDHH